MQTFIAKRVADYYSFKLETEIEIERITIDFFESIDLHQLYIEDRNSDTLIYLDQLKIGINKLDWENESIDITLNLSQPKVNIGNKGDTAEFNYEFISRYFASEDSATSNLYDIIVTKLNVNNGQFQYHDLNYDDLEEGFNYNHLDVSNLNIQASKIRFYEDQIKARIEVLSLIEENGFAIDKMQCDLYIEDSDIKVDQLTIQTKGSEISADIHLLSDSMSQYTNFINEVDLQWNFRNSLIHVDDIAYFAFYLHGIKEQIYINGGVKGTISNIHGEAIELQLNKETIIVGDLDLRGLPNLEKTFMLFNLRDLRTSAVGLRKLPYPPFDEENGIPIPKNFDRLGEMRFVGSFSGYYNDFVAFGDFKTDLGEVKTDLSLTDVEEHNFRYKGRLKSESFDAGSLFYIDGIKNLDFDLEVDGVGISEKTINARAKGIVHSFDFYGYNYKDIDIHGELVKKTFLGKVKVNDENLKLAFDGKIDANEENLISQYTLQVDKAKLVELNWLDLEDDSTQIAFSADLNLSGTHIDNVDGEILISDFKYNDSEQDQYIKSLKLFAKENDGLRTIDVESSLFTTNITGKFKWKETRQAILNMLADYIPKSRYEKKKVDHQQFEFKITLLEADPILKILSPSLWIDSSTTIKGEFDSDKDFSSLSIQSPKLKLFGSTFEQLNVNFKAEDEKIDAKIVSQSVQFLGLTDLNSFHFTSELYQGVNDVNLSWKGINQHEEVGLINMVNTIKSPKNISLRFGESFILVNDSIWSFNEQAYINIDSDTIEVSNLEIASEQHRLFVDGFISRDSTKQLDVTLKNFDLNYISSLFPNSKVSLTGLVNGDASIKNAYNQLSLISNIVFEDLVINEVEVGNSLFESKWKPSQQALGIQLDLGGIDDRLVYIEGDFYPFRRKDKLNLRLQTDNFPIVMIAPFIEEYITEMKGTVNGQISVKGDIDRPMLEGRMNINQAELKVNYLNTKYKINDEIIVEPDFIGVDLIDIYDSRGKKAMATGTVFHNNYSDFNFDIGIELNDFLTLNTSAQQNDLFYGKGVTSGAANITGYDDHLIFELDLKAEKGTDFKIPFSEDIEVSTSNFVVFTNSPDYQKQAEQEKVDLSGIELDFDLEVMPEAKVQIIFDEQIGDVIKAQGEGNIKLEINTIGDFNIYGEYKVLKGDYLFTLRNIVNKKFDLAKGSSIFWDGDPYQARIDMQAIYNLRAPLYHLFPGDSTSGFRRRIPVELELQMKNFLLSPEIEFDIRLPTADERTKSELESILYLNSNEVNRQEMNQQVFGLLVLNRFMPPAIASTSVSRETGERTTPGLNNGYEFLSNQLSNWFSKISDQFDVGVNYRPADEINSEEVDLSLSTEVLNDRLILDGNIGYIGNSAQYIEDNNQTTNFIGEFSAEYKVSRDGRLRVKGFNRSTQNSLLQFNSPYTQGVGLFYREEFDTAQELWKKYFRAKK